MDTRRRSEAGISILEIMIALVVIAIALLAVTSLLFSSNRVQQDGKERMIAFNGARQVLEDMRAVEFNEVWHRYNATTADDKTGSNPGDRFTVAGLPPRKDNTPNGRIYFPEDSTGANVSEDPSSQSLKDSLGMYRTVGGVKVYGKDLNRDGDALDLFNDNAQFFILPVMIEVVWVTPGGRENKVEMVSFLSSKTN